MLSREIKGREHFVYESIDEYKLHGGDSISIKYWKDGEEGDWVKSDDGGIVQILKKGTLDHRKDSENYKSNKGYVRTIVGSFIINKNSKMDTDFEQHPNRYTFSKNLKNSNENFKKRKTTTTNEKLFTTQVITGQSAITAVQNVYKMDDYKKAKSKAMLLLKQERIMNEIDRGVNEIAKDMGINHEYVLGRLKMLADSSQDDNVILQSAKELGKIIGTSNNILKKHDTGVVGLFGGFSPEQLEKAQREVTPLELKNESK
tara:strand:+ start:3102 stop:3878 length:777 start_codon:yes stop_codon:yes gene_type:complete